LITANRKDSDMDDTNTIVGQEPQVETATEGNSHETETNTQAGKMFSQDELNAIVAKRIAQEQKKFDGFDLDEYREMKTAKEKASTDRLKRDGNYEKLLQQTKDKHDSETAALRAKLTGIQVDGALVNAAASQKAVNPQHVAELLKTQVTLDESGSPVVLDNEGNVRYNTEKASPYTIDELVDEFVNSNPYFKSATPSGTGSNSNTSNPSTQSVDISSLDLTRSDHREIYREMKAAGKV